jgi:hypothetical protein
MEKGLKKRRANPVAALEGNKHHHLVMAFKNEKLGMNTWWRRPACRVV